MKNHAARSKFPTLPQPHSIVGGTPYQLSSSVFYSIPNTTSYTDTCFSDFPEKQPHLPSLSSAQDTEQQPQHPCRFVRLKAFRRTDPATAPVNQYSLIYSFLPTRIERRVPADAHIHTIPFADAAIMRPSKGTSLEIRSPRPSRAFHTAEFMVRGEYAVKGDEKEWNEFLPRSYFNDKFVSIPTDLDPEPTPTPSLTPAWPTCSFVLSIPSFGINPSPIPALSSSFSSPRSHVSDSSYTSSLFEYLSLTAPRHFATTRTHRFSPFAEKDEYIFLHTTSPVKPKRQWCSTPDSIALCTYTSPTSTASLSLSPVSEFSFSSTSSTSPSYSSPGTSITSLRTDVDMNQELILESVQIASLILALDERKEMSPDKKTEELQKLFEIWKGTYEKVKNVVDATGEERVMDIA